MLEYRPSPWELLLVELPLRGVLPYLEVVLASVDVWQVLAGGWRPSESSKVRYRMEVASVDSPIGSTKSLDSEGSERY
jgi:hypothetical protein